jgi:hypothetical protein
VFYGSKLYRKDNPRWVISNATERPQVPDAAFRLFQSADRAWEQQVIGLPPASGIWGLLAEVTRRVRTTWGFSLSWLIGLPRRAGTRLYAANDAEARWWGWQVTERWGGLVRQYRDARFDLLPRDPAIRRTGLTGDLVTPDHAPPDCSCAGDQ